MLNFWEGALLEANIARPVEYSSLHAPDSFPFPFIPRRNGCATGLRMECFPGVISRVRAICIFEWHEGKT